MGAHSIRVMGGSTNAAARAPRAAALWPAQGLRHPAPPVCVSTVVTSEVCVYISIEKSRLGCVRCVDTRGVYLTSMVYLPF